MGQPSLASWNKSGESMYWSSMWDQKNNFEQALNDSLFLKELVPSFFTNFSDRRIISYMHKVDFSIKKDLLLNKYNTQVTKKFNYNELCAKIEKNYDRMFFSQIWVLKFQNWVFIYFFVYYPLLKKKKTIVKKKKKLNHFLNNIVNNYLNSIVYIKYKKKKSYNMYSHKYNF